MIDAEVGPDVAVIVADNRATEKDRCLVDVVFVVDGKGVLFSFHVVANPDDATWWDSVSQRVPYRFTLTQIVVHPKNSEDCLAVRSLAGGKKADDATMASLAASGCPYKPTKKPLSGATRNRGVSAKLEQQKN